MAGVTTAGDAKRNDWETPADFVIGVESWLGYIDLDVCATEGTQKACRWFEPEQDGLAQSWTGNTWWCNPPWGRGLIEPWVDKAIRECATTGTRGAMLLPVKCEQPSWRKIEAFADMVLFVHGRQKFVGAISGVNVPTAVIVFDHVMLTGLPPRYGRISRQGLPIAPMGHGMVLP